MHRTYIYSLRLIAWSDGVLDYGVRNAKTLLQRGMKVGGICKSGSPVTYSHGSVHIEMMARSNKGQLVPKKSISSNQAAY